MKITTISTVASLVIFFVIIQTAMAGQAVGIGVGPRFGGGGFGGGSFHSHQRDPISSINHQSTANSRPQIASTMQHPTVTAVQQDLTKLGYYQRSIDGLYGQLCARQSRVIKEITTCRRPARSQAICCKC